MKVDMTLELRDVPGSLIRALSPVSTHGGNIQSVIHFRGGKNRVGVQISFLVSDESSLELIKKELSKASVTVREISVEGRRYYLRDKMTFILVGHIIDKDVKDTIDRLNKFGVVSDVDVLMPDPESESTVLMGMALEKNKRKVVLDELYRICKQKDFLLVRSIE